MTGKYPIACWLAASWLFFGFAHGASADEDCISFNPGNVEVRKIDDRWKIVDGSYWIFDFGSKEAEAKSALAILRHYGTSSVCFVGRPSPSFTYLLVANAAPAGAMQGEDCISFNVNNIRIQQINGHWKIVEGSRWLFDFRKQKLEAGQALGIIRKYNFNRLCFVGRPGPSFVYLRN